MGGFQADAVHIGMHARIGAAAALDVEIVADDAAQSRLERLLHRVGVLLDLPAVKLPSVV